jgi:hypothetical protein
MWGGRVQDSSNVIPADAGISRRRSYGLTDPDIRRDDKDEVADAGIA